MLDADAYAARGFPAEGPSEGMAAVAGAARELAERAGRTLLASLEIRDLQVHFKGHDFADPVSAVDK